MASSTHGASALPVEIGNIDRHGLWLFVGEKEYFLPHESFPWFRNATIGQIVNVELLPGDRLHWPELDVDISLDAITNPEPVPLIFK
jgi:hypothetical protein